MNDREYNAQVKRIRPLIKRWRHVLGLAAWDIGHKFHQGAFASADDPAAWSPAVAETQADYRYLHATITWNMQEVADGDDDTLERQVIHEFVHCLTDPFKRYARGEFGSGVSMSMAEVERQVTELTLALQWAYEAGVQAGKAKKA